MTTDMHFAIKAGEPEARLARRQRWTITAMAGAITAILDLDDSSISSEEFRRQTKEILEEADLAAAAHEQNEAFLEYRAACEKAGWSPDRMMELMDPYDHDAEASATIEAFFDRNPELAVDRLYPDNDPGAEGAVDNLVLWYRDTLGELAKP